MFAVYETATNHVYATYFNEDYAWTIADKLNEDYDASGIDYAVKRIPR